MLKQQLEQEPQLFRERGRGILSQASCPEPDEAEIVMAAKTMS